MNITVIALGVVVIVLLYFLFKMFYNQVVGIDKKYLKEGPTTIDPKKITNNRSTRYNYSTWVYVNTWNNNGFKPLLTKGTSSSAPATTYTVTSASGVTTTTPDGYDFMLWLNDTSPSLMCFIKKPSPSTGNSTEIINITDNFPVQKWVYVIVSVDNQIVDCYLDGKLVTSKKLTFQPEVNDRPITIGGGSNPDIYLVSPKREATPMDPQTAWNNYLRGNGMGRTNSNIKMAYLQDNVEKKYISIPV